MADTAFLPQPEMPAGLNGIDEPLTEPTPEPSGPTQIDSEQAESFISEKRIGERIKHLRLKKAMGLVELGRHTGLSASFLSQLETGRVVPTLRNLARISMVFSKDLSYFFEPEPQKLFRVHRAKDRTRLPQTGVDDPSYYFQSLGLITPDRSLDPYFAEFLPLRNGREARAHQHAGNEFLYVTSGEMELHHGESVHRLVEGDAVYFDAGMTHSYICVGDTPAAAVIVTMVGPIGEIGRNMLRSSGPGAGRVRGARPANGASVSNATPVSNGSAGAKPRVS